MTAAANARREAQHWMQVALAWTPELHPEVWSDLPATEAAVVAFYDPGEDLARRAEPWGYVLGAMDLADVCRFAAGLAEAEAAAWEEDQPHVATRAYTERRLLLGDRVLHWVIPWLEAVSRCYPTLRDDARSSGVTLLDIAEEHRPAPALVGGEGLAPPGEDAFGPVAIDRPPHEWLRSVWSGGVILGPTVRSLTAQTNRDRTFHPGELDHHPLGDYAATLYQTLAARWRRQAGLRPGSARLWLDLSARAGRTARAIHPH